MLAKSTSSNPTRSPSAGSGGGQRTTPTVGKLAGFNPTSVSAQRTSVITKTIPNASSTIAQAKAALFERAAQASSPTSPIVASKRSSISSLGSSSSVGSSPTTPVSASPFRKASIGSVANKDSTPTTSAPFNSSTTGLVGNSPFKRSPTNSVSNFKDAINTFQSSNTTNVPFTPSSLRKPSVGSFNSIKGRVKSTESTTTVTLSAAPTPNTAPSVTTVAVDAQSETLTTTVNSAVKEVSSVVPSVDVQVSAEENLTADNSTALVEVVSNSTDTLESNEGVTMSVENVKVPAMNTSGPPSDEITTSAEPTIAKTEKVSNVVEAASTDAAIKTTADIVTEEVCVKKTSAVESCAGIRVEIAAEEIGAYVEGIAQVEGATASFREIDTPSKETAEEAAGVPIEATAAPVEEATTPFEKTSVAVEETTGQFEEVTSLVEEFAPLVDESTATVEEVVASVEEVVASVEEAAAPVEEITAPTEEISAPAEEVVALVEKVLASVEEVATPVEEVAAPVEEVATPVEEVAALVEEVAAPVEEIAVPVEEMATPVEEVVALIEEIAAPVEEVTALVNEVAMPIEEFTMQAEEVASLAEEVTTQVEELATPVEEVVSPVKGVAAPVEEIAMPTEEISVPVEEVVAPVEEVATLIKEITALIEEVAAPVEEAAVPVEEVAVPVEEIALPAEEIFVPAEEVDVSTKEASALADKIAVYVTPVENAIAPEVEIAAPVWMADIVIEALADSDSEANTDVETLNVTETSMESDIDLRAKEQDTMAETTIEEVVFGLGIESAEPIPSPKQLETGILSQRFHWTHGGGIVKVTGTFDNWQETLVLNEDGDEFSGTINLDRTKIIHFKFVVDGVWRCSPDYATENDGCGNENNILEPIPLY